MNTPGTRRAVAVFAALLLLAVASSSNGVVQAGSRGHGLAGTWFVSLPGGLTGFYTYNQDGTGTGTVSTIFGAEPQPPGALANAGADHGVWRQVGDGFESVVFRMSFDPMSGSPVDILRIRTFFAFDSGRDRTFGTFDADLWFCDEVIPGLTFTTCPDPNSTSPDVVGVTPPPPLNTFIQTRVHIP